MSWLVPQGQKVWPPQTTVFLFSFILLDSVLQFEFAHNAIRFEIIATSAQLDRLPLHIVNLAISMVVNPYFSLLIIPHALVLLMQSIEGPTHDVILLLQIASLQLYPLGMLDQF